VIYGKNGIFVIIVSVIIVIIAGGSGTRLWPLSTPDYPKHLLKINGDDFSLLQHTFNRAKQMSDQIYVVTEQGHVQHIKEQLNELPDEAFIVEPGRRGTANCIIAALAHISKTSDGSEPIAFTHSDHYVRDTEGLIDSFNLAAEVSAQEGRIVLVGVEPTYPATGFGYIQKDGLLDEDRFVYNVNSFKEKPAYDLAREYIASGNYLWNCGYFVGSIDVFLDKMRNFAPELLQSYEQLKSADDETYEQTYLGLESDTIDYALIEKVNDLLVIPAAFDWMDLGSFADIATAVGGDEQGNHFYGPQIEALEIENSLVHNYETKPVAVIGLDNIVVVNTPQGLLVTRKDLSQKVGEIAKKLNNQ
jgi:mannose-1-phosphate guanylyltransferase/mannose-6-phosphate isomerase